jgi:hypothetical protein
MATTIRLVSLRPSLVTVVRVVLPLLAVLARVVLLVLLADLLVAAQS